MSGLPVARADKAPGKLGLRWAVFRFAHYDVRGATEQDPVRRVWDRLLVFWPSVGTGLRRQTCLSLMEQVLTAARLAGELQIKAMLWR